MSTTVFSAHPAIAAEQLQQAELETCGSGTNNNSASSRRHSCNSGKYSTRTTPHKKFTSRSCSISAKSATNSSAKAAASETVSNDATIKFDSNSSKTATNNTTAEMLNTMPASTAEQCKSAKNTHDDVVASQNNKTIPDRTNYASVDDDDDDDDNVISEDNVGGKVAYNGIVRQTKDCINNSTKVPALEEEVESVDVTDHVQQRFTRKNSQHAMHSAKSPTAATAPTPSTTATTTINHRQYITETVDQCPGPIGDGGCLSGVSSVISSPSASTVSSPLSTPTRLAPLQQLQHGRHYCCQKSAEFSSMQNRQHHNFHYHNQHHHFKKSECNMGDTNSACKKKLDPRLSPSPYRQLLPIALCILSFAAVFATLIVYMDTTEIRHQQFRLNMSRDYELNSVAQDDPSLIAFLRQIHMRKSPMKFLKNNEAVNEAQSAVPPPPPALVPNSHAIGGATVDRQQLLNMSSALNGDNLAPTMAHYVADLFGGKLNGAVIQSLTGPTAHLITAPWLSENLHWMGVLVEPEPRWYFTLRKQNAQQQRMQIVHACVSPNSYPKEITIHNEDVRINSLHDEEISWFNSRVKCFPLYTIMLACERVKYDLLSLGVQGHELDILQTLPFDKVQIDVISIHLLEDHDDLRGYVQSITKFLAGKSYKLQGKFGQNFFYQHYSMSRNRNKDTLTLKTP